MACPGSLRMFLILASLAAGALMLGRPAVAQNVREQALPQFSEAAHIGVQNCSGSTCHNAKSPSPNSSVAQNEYTIWSGPDKHSKAFSVLGNDRSQRIARNLRIGDPRSAAICLSCHSDNATHRGPQFNISEGVGCEACHGGAQSWLGTHISGFNHEANLKAGLFPTNEPKARARLCLSCHVGSGEGKFVTHVIMGAGHPRLKFELNTSTQMQPAHYVVDKDYVARKGAPSGVRTWAIGQAMALSETLRAFVDPKRNPAGFVPELVFYDCNACHHPMSNLRYAPHEPGPAQPGVVPFNDANVIMLRVLAARVDPGLARAFDERVVAFHKALQENRTKSIAEARALLDLTNRLEVALGGHGYGADDLKALAAGLIASAEHGNFGEYSAAEQGTRALWTITQTMRGSGMVSEAQRGAVEAAMGQLEAAIAKEEGYRPDTYALALQNLGQALGL